MVILDVVLGVQFLRLLRGVSYSVRPWSASWTRLRSPTTPPQTVGQTLDPRGPSTLVSPVHCQILRLVHVQSWRLGIVDLFFRYWSHTKSQTVDVPLHRQRDSSLVVTVSGRQSESCGRERRVLEKSPSQTTGDSKFLFQSTPDTCSPLE